MFLGQFLMDFFLTERGVPPPPRTVGSRKPNGKKLTEKGGTPLRGKFPCRGFLKPSLTGYVLAIFIIKSIIIIIIIIIVIIITKGFVAGERCCHRRCSRNYYRCIWPVLSFLFLYLYFRCWPPNVITFSKPNLTMSRSPNVITFSKPILAMPNLESAV